MSLERAVAPDPYDYLPVVPSFALSSDDIADGEALDLRFVHDSAGGSNVSPQLSWSGAPEGTHSFLVTCLDPDAPTGSGFWHWSAVDLPGDVDTLARAAGASDDSLPGPAFHVRNDFGNARYDGAAPPPGDRAHRYMFVVHAVDVPTLGVTAHTAPAAVAFQLAFHTLGRARLIGTFAH